MYTNNLFLKKWDSKWLIEWKSDSCKIVRGLFENVSFEKRPRILGPFPEWWDSKPSSEWKSFSEKRIHNNPSRFLYIKRFVWEDTQNFWVLRFWFPFWWLFRVWFSGNRLNRMCRYVSLSLLSNVWSNIQVHTNIYMHRSTIECGWMECAGIQFSSRYLDIYINIFVYVYICICIYKYTYVHAHIRYVCV